MMTNAERDGDFQNHEPYHEGRIVVVAPTEIDVMCGAGHAKNHSGNELFKRIVSQFIERYACAQSSKREKMQITKTILEVLTQQGIRFLKKSNAHQHWYVADQKVARDKIGHFLRLGLKKKGSSTAAHRPPNTRPVNVTSSSTRSTSPFFNAAALSAASTPLAHFLVGGGSTTPAALTPMLQNSIFNDHISSIWINIMENDKSSQECDYSRPFAGISRLQTSSQPQQQLSNQTAVSFSPAPSSQFNYNYPSEEYQASASLTSSLSQSFPAQNSLFSKIRTQPSFLTNAPSHGDHHHDLVTKKEGTAHASFQKAVADGTFQLMFPRLKEKDAVASTSALLSYTRNETDSFDACRPIPDFSAVAPLSSNVDGWSRLPWSSVGSINTKNETNTTRLNGKSLRGPNLTPEDLFDESDLAVRLD